MYSSPSVITNLNEGFAREKMISVTKHIFLQTTIIFSTGLATSSLEENNGFSIIGCFTRCQASVWLSGELEIYVCHIFLDCPSNLDTTINGQDGIRIVPFDHY
jgi:hypothetical protein